MAQTIKKVSGHNPKNVATKRELSNKARWKKAAELLKELEKLKFKDAAKAVRRQVATEMKEALKKGNSSKRPVEISNSEDEYESESYDETSSSEEDETTTHEESSSEESSEEEEESESEEEDVAKPVRAKRPVLTRKAVSFSDDDNDVRLLSPRKGSKETLFYSRAEIERFRLDERMRKTEEASANLTALIADAQLLVQRQELTSVATN